ncbi:hypothetical protein SAMN04487949_1896 [Halogranum gelatinilyticum]|uniref:Uncharacterized protein n=1 Tax=Halogranum gelatinilyticum TaxID=660521 RepID=A0A1G9TSP4_9EURY|nr:hypothetical protein [Halogranum gelatinilyticum]SDM50749.1 hypothetical protein SAMN04487949_1896 [Halogranum gelatinilyticum]
MTEIKTAGLQSRTTVEAPPFDKSDDADCAVCGIRPAEGLDARTREGVCSTCARLRCDGGRDEYDFFDLEGETEIDVRCTTPCGAPDLCDGWNETVELDEPAYIDENERVHFPGFEWQCPECGNPYEFVVNGVEVSNLV